MGRIAFKNSHEVPPSRILHCRRGVELHPRRGIVVDCIEMDTVSQEWALLEGRISLGILVPSDRPVLELLHLRL